MSFSTHTSTSRLCVVEDILAIFFAIHCLTHKFAELHPGRECRRQRCVQQGQQGRLFRLLVCPALCVVQPFMWITSLTVSLLLIANVPSTTPSISAADAISKAESELGGAYTGHPTKIEFVAKQDGSVALTHVVQVRDDSEAMWYEAFVDAHTSDIVQLTDFVAHASVGLDIRCNSDRP